MRGHKSRYTFVIEFLGGTYVRQATRRISRVALRVWLRLASEENLEWASHRAELLRAVSEEVAVPIEGCQNVWCISGLAGDHLFLIHIIGTESGPAQGNSVAEAQMEQLGADPRRWGWEIAADAIPVRTHPPLKARAAAVAAVVFLCCALSSWVPALLRACAQLQAFRPAIDSLAPFLQHFQDGWKLTTIFGQQALMVLRGTPSAERL